MAEQKTQRQEKNFPDRFFGISESGSTMRTEILAGITTFFAMAYILVVNPQILSAPFIIRGETVYAAQVANGVFFATCLIAFIGTLLMAVYAKVPFAQAPGMGLNAFFAYTVVLGMGYSYQQALAMVFISGLLFIFITAIGFREACVRAIPQPVKAAMSAGIGLFLALIGLVVTGVLFSRRIRGAIFIGILVSTLAGIPFGLTALHEFSFNLTGQMQDFREISLFNMDFAGLFRNTSNLFEMALTVIMIVISFSLVDMFDTIGTLLGTAKQAKMLDGNGDMPRMKEAMMCDAIATTAGACLGSSTATVFVESSTGIAEGGRTGMTALVTSLLFLASLVIAPVITVIPAAATAPALIFVGVLMMGSVREVDFSDMTSAIPSFVTMVFMPFTYSIANGIAFGLITYVLIGLLMGRIRQIHCLTVILCLLFVLRFAFMVTG